MKLRVHPRKPRWTPLYKASLHGIRRQEWIPFLSVLDISYWNTELLE
jgi:hypothetical protein